MTEYSDLPPRERARIYRELAEDARKQAATCPRPDLREAYIVIAGRWDDLALDVEQRLSRENS